MKKYYFQVVSISVLVFSIIGFSDNLVTDIGQESNSDPKFIIHGLFWLSWMFIYVTQTTYIKNKNHKAHKRLGITAMFVAAGVVFSTLYVFVAVYEGWDKMEFFVKANRIFLLSFAILVVLGYLNRIRSDNHKRFMWLATILILEPILSRVSGRLDVDPYILIPVIWNALFISLFLYDWLTRRNIHPITYSGFIWFWLVWAISILL
jgi:hypothetical protein